jgi:Putative sensor
MTTTAHVPTAHPAQFLAELSSTVVSRRTWLRTAHLLADLPVGIVAATLAAGAGSFSAGLALTVAGIPLLVLTLAAARGYGRLERARVRMLLGVAMPAPVPFRGGLHPRWWLPALTDRHAWTALLHALIALPLGIVNATVTLTGWTTALTCLVSPLALAWLPSNAHLGGLQLASPIGTVVTVLAGAALTLAMPAVVRGLAALDALLARLLLTGR